MSGADNRVSTTGVGDRFAVLAVLLVVEGKTGLSGSVHFLVGAVDENVEFSESDGARDVL